MKSLLADPYVKLHGPSFAKGLAHLVFDCHDGRLVDKNMLVGIIAIDETISIIGVLPFESRGHALPAQSSHWSPDRL